MTPADALVVNHRVHLAGSTSGVVSHTVGYIGTREGCVTEETDDDRLRAGQAEALDARFVGYVSGRPGSVVDHDGSGLFDASGTRTVSGVRAELDANAGAVVTSVVSVRRSDGEAMRLETRQDFERLLRSEWAPLMARAMGVPEQDVRWVAAFHLNSDASYHAHVITWDASGRFDRLLDRARMEETRRELASVALAPICEVLERERTLARDEAVLAARALDAHALAEEVHLPETGSLKVAWLRREHAGVAAALDHAVSRAMAEDPTLASAVGRHREAVCAMAELKGLEGPARKRYVATAETDLKERITNAAVSAMVPDRSARPHMACTHIAEEDAPSPAFARRRELALAEEISACVPASERRGLASAASTGSPMRHGPLSRCPTWRAARIRAPGVARTLDHVSATLGQALDAPEGRGAGDEAGREAMREIARLVCFAIELAGAGRGTAAQVARTIERARGLAL